MQAQPMMGAQPFIQPWMNPSMMNRPMMYNPPMQQQTVLKEEAKQSEVINKETENKIGEASGNMVNVLKNSTNEKHRNSQFL